MVKKTEFVVKESKTVSRVKRRWRYPRGKHSKVRQRHSGRPALPTPGFGSPKEVRGKINGMEPVLVYRLEDLTSINPKHLCIVSSSVGKRKKQSILKKCLELKLNVGNYKDIPAGLKLIETNLAERKKVRAEKKSLRSGEAEARKKKAEKKKTEEKEKEKKSVEDTVKDDKVQKKELEKTMIKPQ